MASWQRVAVHFRHLTGTIAALAASVAVIVFFWNLARATATVNDIRESEERILREIRGEIRRGNIRSDQQMIEIRRYHVNHLRDHGAVRAADF